MPRLLPFDALDGPPVRARWTAILAAALAITALNTDWTAAWDTTRGLVPPRTDRFEWSTADLDTAFDAETFPGDYEGLTNPAQAGNAQLRAKGVLLDLVWDETLTIATVRVETYTDAYGTGHRLALALDSTTAAGIGCLNASLRTAEANADDSTTLQYCTRTDLRDPPEDPSGQWRPLRLFLTQTANLDPAAYYDPLVDYFGFGFETGDAFDTGLWRNGGAPKSHLAPECQSEPEIYLGLDDLHLTDRYSDPTFQRSGPRLTHEGSPAYPVENRLVLPACTPIDGDYLDNATALEPYFDITLMPLSSWAEFNASTAEPQPLRTAVAIDVRSCDADADTCSSDQGPDDPSYASNDGIASDWLTELLHTS
jgi:hypothetical protein